MRNMARSLWMWIFPDYFGHEGAYENLKALTNQELIEETLKPDYMQKYGMLPLIVELRSRLAYVTGYKA